MYSYEEILKADPEIAQAITDEMKRQNSHIELIASENWVSKAVMAEARLRISMRKDTLQNDIMEAVNVWT